MRQPTRTSDRTTGRFLRGRWLLFWLFVGGVLPGIAAVPTLTLAQNPAVVDDATTKQPSAAAQPPTSAKATDSPEGSPAATIEGEQKFDKAQDDKLKQELLSSKNAKKILREGQLNNETRDVISQWARWRVYRLTVQENFPELHAGAKNLISEIRDAAKFNSNPNQSRTFREFVLQEVTSRAAELLDLKFHREVRLNVAVVLLQLNIVEAEPAVVYIPAMVPMLQALGNKDEHLSVKITLVNGLKRILLESHPSRDQKNSIAVALLSELESNKSKSTYYWYPMRLVEALGCIDEPAIAKINNNSPIEQRPFHVQALAVAMRDSSLDWLVRAEAAKSLGRVPLQGNVNVALVCHEIVRLGSDMGKAYNQAPKKFFWQECLWKTYLSFQEEDEIEGRRISGVRPSPLVTKRSSNQKVVTDAYAQILPLAKHILKQPVDVNGKLVMQSIPDPLLQTVEEWLRDNQPSSNRITPGLPPLEQRMAVRKSSFPQTVTIGKE